MNKDDDDKVTLKFPFLTSIFPAKRAAEVITVILLGTVIYGGVILYEHSKNADGYAQANARSAKKLLTAMKELTVQQRLTACILSTQDVQRKEEFRDPSSFCNRTSKLPDWEKSSETETK